MLSLFFDQLCPFLLSIVCVFLLVGLPARLVFFLVYFVACGLVLRGVPNLYYIIFYYRLLEMFKGAPGDDFLV